MARRREDKKIPGTGSSSSKGRGKSALRNHKGLWGEVGRERRGRKGKPRPVKQANF